MEEQLNSNIQNKKSIWSYGLNNFYLCALSVSVVEKNKGPNKNPDKGPLIGAEPTNPSKI